MSCPKSQLPEQATVILPPMATSSTPILNPPAAVDTPAPFLRAPREIRDEIYRLLLLTKHTKHIKYTKPFKHNYVEPEMDQSKYFYTYRFHTSVFLTNRQVYFEASNVFYMENLFVRVNFNLQPEMFGEVGFEEHDDHGLPFLYWRLQDHACKRHVMEIDSNLEPQRYGRSSDRHFMLASDDLPMFCKTLLTMDGVGNLRDKTELLRGMELWITIGDEVGTTREDSSLSYMSPDDKKAESLDVTTKNAAAHRAGTIDSLRTITESNATIRENRNGSGSPTVIRITAKSPLPEAPSDIDNSRIRKLLEPLRAMYSVGFSYIDAPISERYRHEIQTSLSRARPGIDVRFHVPSSAFEEAMRTFSAEDFALAIQKLRGTLDTLLDFRRCCNSREMMSTIVTGPFAGLSFREAAVKMRCLIWNHLARANLKFHKDIQHVRTAQAWLLRIMDTYIYSQWQPGTHESAMLYYLNAEIWEALDQLGEHTGRPRSDTLQDVVCMLTQALHHEPGNAMLKQELERRQRERRTAEVIEEARKWERDEGRVLSRERIG